MNAVVIGLGSMGRRRIRILKARDDVDIIIGIDSNYERSRQVEKEMSVVCYTSFNDIPTEISSAFICTSPLSHARIIKACISKGWNVFTEINLVSDMYNENMELAEKSGVTLFLSSTFLYRDEIRYIINLKRENKKPCIYNYHVGQYLPDWHPWDKLEDFFISDKRTNGCRELLAIELPWIQKAFGKIQSVNVIQRKMTELKINYNDVYLIQLEHEDGSMGNLLVDVVSRKATRSLEVFNEELYLNWKGTPNTLRVLNAANQTMEAVRLGKYIHEVGYADNINEQAYIDEVDTFFKTIRGEEIPNYNFKDDIITLRLIDEIEKRTNS